MRKELSTVLLGLALFGCSEPSEQMLMPRLLHQQSLIMRSKPTSYSPANCLRTFVFKVMPVWFVPKLTI